MNSSMGKLHGDGTTMGMGVVIYVDGGNCTMSQDLQEGNYQVCNQCLYRMVRSYFFFLHFQEI
jgi:hypothetical protein